jgi:hypothetical protein
MHHTVWRMETKVIHHTLLTHTYHITSLSLPVCLPEESHLIKT